MMSIDELIRQKELLEALGRKCKTDALYLNTRDGIKVINRELAILESHSFLDGVCIHCGMEFVLAKVDCNRG